MIRVAAVRASGEVGRYRQSYGAAGFTLVELVVVVALIAILSAVAAPQMVALTNSNRLSAANSELTSALQLARSEAIRRGARVTVCPTSNGTACASTTTWSRWIIVGRDNTTGTNDVIRDYTPAGTIRLSGPQAGVRFNPSGLANAEATVMACIPTVKPRDNQREIRILVSGSIMSSKKNGGGTCP